MLNLFLRYDIHATWAIVGLLHYESIAALKRDKHQQIPYKNAHFSPFPLSAEKYGTFDPAVLLAPEMLEQIGKTTYQEIGSHTFSHFYCCEEGISVQDFDADCKQMEAVRQKIGCTFSSIVFPRNQVNAKLLPILNNYGIKAFRGNQENKFWKNSSFTSESFFKKLGRVTDAYFKNSTTKAYTLSTLKKENGLLNIPANRFFRPVTNWNWLEKRKIKRIKKEMFKAAKNGCIYHLWWHPHNFSTNTALAMLQLEEIFAYYHVLHQKFGFESLNMSEITANARN